jgi:transposase
MPNGWTYAVDRVGPTSEQATILCREAEKGYSVAACAAEADVSPFTVRSWMRRGRDARERLERDEEIRPTELVIAGFVERFERARAKGVRALEDLSTKRANEGLGTWMEAARKLERLDPEDWADKTRQPLEAGGIQIVIAGMLPERVVHVGEIIDADARADEELPAAPAALREIARGDCPMGS